MTGNSETAVLTKDTLSYQETAMSCGLYINQGFEIICQTAKER
jgi:hypothetical protein